MKNGPRLTMSSRQPKPATRRTLATAATLAHKASPNAQRNDERYLALARTEARASNPVGAENYYQHAEHYFRSMSSTREKRLAPAGGIKANGASPWGSLEGRRPIG
jgi:hypothetical protein